MYVYGIGGIGVVAIDLLSDLGIPVVGYYDDSGATTLFRGLSIMPGIGGSAGNVSDIAENKPLICIGNNGRRKELIEIINPDLSVLLHPTAIISKSATVGNCSMVFHGSCIQASAVLGAGVIVNTAGSIDHDCTIGDYCHIAPHVTLCGGVNVGEGANIGAGAVVIPNISIGSWSIIGAGAVIIRDVPAFSTVVGNPGRIIQQGNEGFT